MPQLTMMTSAIGLSLYFRWPYHAKVMNTLEGNSIRTGSSCGEMVGMAVLSKKPGANIRREAGLLADRAHLNTSIGKLRPWHRRRLNARGRKAGGNCN